jgi:hypothetical protein
LSGGHDELRTCQQRREKLPYRRIETIRRLLQDCVGVIEPMDPLHPQHVIADRGMRHHDALRAAGGTGRVNHVSNIACRCLPRHRHGGLPGNGWPVGIEGDGPLADRRELRLQPVLGQHHRGLHVLQHVSHPLYREVRLYGHVGSPGFEYAEHAHNHLQGALDAQRNQCSAPYSPSPEVLGELICTRVEFTVAQVFPFEHDRYRFWRPTGLRLE